MRERAPNAWLAVVSVVAVSRLGERPSVPVGFGRCRRFCARCCCPARRDRIGLSFCADRRYLALQDRTRPELRNVGGGDADRAPRVTRIMRVATLPPLGAELAPTRKGDLVALNHRLRQRVENGLQRSVRGRLRQLGALGECLGELTFVHCASSVSPSPSLPSSP